MAKCVFKPLFYFLKYYSLARGVSLSCHIVQAVEVAARVCSLSSSQVCLVALRHMSCLYVKSMMRGRL